MNLEVGVGRELRRPFSFVTFCNIIDVTRMMMKDGTARDSVDRRVTRSGSRAG